MDSPKAHEVSSGQALCQPGINSESTAAVVPGAWAYHGEPCEACRLAVPMKKGQDVRGL